MGMPVATEQRYWLPDDVWELPEDGNRYECIDGELLVSPSPRELHQYVVGEFYVRLHSYLKANRVGSVVMSPADIRLEPTSVVQPDLFVAPNRPPDPQAKGWRAIRSLLIAVEVVSPSTARYDRITKRAFYQRTGVSEYWIVDSDARVVERWRPGDERPEILTDELSWAPTGVPSPLVIGLPELFDEAWRSAVSAGIEA